MKKILVVLAVAGLSVLATSCEKLKARDQLNKGVQAYKNAQYPQAVENFKTAVQLDPNFPTARLYLATAYMSQYIPGADSPENVQMAQAAHDQFAKVLEQDPKNEVAIASIASLYFNQKKLDDAKTWYEKLSSVNPQNKEAFYTLGVIAWTKSFQPRMEARAKMSMKPEDPGPLKDKKIREELAAKNSRDLLVRVLSSADVNLATARRNSTWNREYAKATGAVVSDAIYRTNCLGRYSR